MYQISAIREERSKAYHPRSIDLSLWMMFFTACLCFAQFVSDLRDAHKSGRDIRKQYLASLFSQALSVET